MYSMSLKDEVTILMNATKDLFKILSQGWSGDVRLKIKKCAPHHVSGSYSSYSNNSHVKLIRI